MLPKHWDCLLSVRLWRRWTKKRQLRQENSSINFATYTPICVNRLCGVLRTRWRPTTTAWHISCIKKYLSPSKRPGCPLRLKVLWSP
ncbi:hypothetical protein P879_00967 [Paragonimus westermani]|uniref:Uncharacterized protein n=1 Tax=Paragonimus westermani TaxID=34504 RepID=A0A8T0DP24_9TREM|nr:hypothetical protein P879_00967 [Paragonimus westermani]